VKFVCCFRRGRKRNGVEAFRFSELKWSEWLACLVKWIHDSSHKVRCWFGESERETREGEGVVEVGILNSLSSIRSFMY
jgi:hypothetical protein